MVENNFDLSTLDLPDGYSITGWLRDPNKAYSWCHLVKGDKFAIISLSRYEKVKNRGCMDDLMRSKIHQAIFSIKLYEENY